MNVYFCNKCDFVRQCNFTSFLNEMERQVRQCLINRLLELVDLNEIRFQVYFLFFFHQILDNFGSSIIIIKNYQIIRFFYQRLMQRIYKLMVTLGMSYWSVASEERKVLGVSQ